jgi:hypothetical protein
MVRTTFAQPNAQTVRELHRRIVDQLETRFPDAARLLGDARQHVAHEVGAAALPGGRGASRRSRRRGRDARPS